MENQKNRGMPRINFSTEAWNRLKELRLRGASLRRIATTLMNEGLVPHISFVSVRNYLPQIDAELAKEGWRKEYISLYQHIAFVKDTE